MREADARHKCAPAATHRHHDNEAMTMRHTPELAAAAYHESGHAVAIVTAFREAAWLPQPAPLMPVRFIEVSEDGQGNCAGINIYSATWPIDVLVPRYRDLMERQVCIHLSGGISEAILCGVRGGREALRFAESSMGVDLTKAEEVLRDIFRLTGYRVGPQHYADRTLTMLLEHWSAIEALAEALIEDRRIEGRLVERIIDRSMIGSAS